jgi:hypothetical protein
MLELLAQRGKQRKVRLFACACCRRLWDRLTDPRSRWAVEVSERYADRLAEREELLRAHQEAHRVIPRGVNNAEAWMTDVPWRASALERDQLLFTSQAARNALATEGKAHPPLLRDIFGPGLFRRIAVDPSWLRWNDGAVRHLARLIYDERRFQDLPILGDALEEAGCGNEEILSHCRLPGEHVRGCWVVDLMSRPGQGR